MKSMQPRKTRPQWRNHKETRIIIKKMNKKKLTLKGTHIANTDFMSTLKSASTSVSLAQHTMDPNISTLLARNPLPNLRNPNPRQLSPTPRFNQNPVHLQDQSQSQSPLINLILPLLRNSQGEDGSYGGIEKTNKLLHPLPHLQEESKSSSPQENSKEQFHLQESESSFPPETRPMQVPPQP